MHASGIRPLLSLEAETASHPAGWVATWWEPAGPDGRSALRAERLGTADPAEAIERASALIGCEAADLDIAKIHRTNP